MEDQSTKKFSCSVCDAKFTVKSNLTRHCRNVHKLFMDTGKEKPMNGQFTCSLCNTNFNEQSNLTRHCRNVHKLFMDTGKKKPRNRQVTCSLCDTKFSGKSNLTRHCKNAHQLFMDTGKEKPRNGQFTCSLCDTKFTEKSNLNRHYRLIHYLSTDSNKKKSEGKFHCNVCNTTFSKKANLTRHNNEQHVSTNDKATVIACPVCNDSFIRYRNLFRHLNLKHDGENGTCSECNETFSDLISLFKHKKDKHLILEKENKKKFYCDQCEKKFTQKSNLNTHLEKVHKINCRRPPSKLCPLCDAAFQTIPILDKHLVENHNVQLKEEILDFDSVEDFKKWKTDIEKEDLAFFTFKKSFDNTTYYECHRSGAAKSTGTSSRFKRTHSTKTGKNCIGRIITTNNQGRIKVYSQRTHVGHTQSINFLRLTKDERDELAGKLRAGLTFDRILDDIRESASFENIGRKHLINKRDLYNIVRDYKLDEDVAHINDAISVDMWVEQEQSLGENSPVLYYQQQGVEGEDEFELAANFEVQNSEILKASQGISVHVGDSVSLLTRIDTLLNIAQGIAKTTKKKILSETVHRLEDFVEFLRKNQTDHKTASSSIPRLPKLTKKHAQSSKY